MQSFEILSDEEFDELEALLDGFLTAVFSGSHFIIYRVVGLQKE